MKLGIISHTAHYTAVDGSIVGWGPTIREVNYLAQHFEKIYHVACLHKGNPPGSSLKYTEKNIEFVPIPPFGGNDLKGKLSVISTMPVILRKVKETIEKVDFFQIRLPTGFGNYLLPWLKIYHPKAKFWVKYAGNWVQKNPPLGYTFQRWWLKNNFSGCKVTINGCWPDQPNHVISFENPCLYEQERLDGLEILKSKQYDKSLDFAFIGNLTEAKGVCRILEAFKNLTKAQRIGTLHIVGDGIKRNEYETIYLQEGIRCIFYGFLPRKEVNKILTISHILLLPSESEGFPKVVAEGANYGCIPVVSGVSSIPQYIKNNINGFIIPSNDAQGLLGTIEQVLSLDHNTLANIALNAHKLGEYFTYERYVKRIQNEIIGSPTK